MSNKRSEHLRTRRPVVTLHFPAYDYPFTDHPQTETKKWQRNADLARNNARHVVPGSKERGPKTCHKCGHQFVAQQQEAPAVEAVPAPAEKPTKPGDAVTIEQIKAVGQMVKTVGGFGRFREMLEVIRQVGGLKRLRDILDAMAVTEGEGK